MRIVSDIKINKEGRNIHLIDNCKNIYEAPSLMSKYLFLSLMIKIQKEVANYLNI